MREISVTLVLVVSHSISTFFVALSHGLFAASFITAASAFTICVIALLMYCAGYEDTDPPKH